MTTILHGDAVDGKVHSCVQRAVPPSRATEGHRSHARNRGQRGTNATYTCELGALGTTHRVCSLEFLCRPRGSHSRERTGVCAHPGSFCARKIAYALIYVCRNWTEGLSIRTMVGRSHRRLSTSHVDSVERRFISIVLVTKRSAGSYAQTYEGLLHT
jgi:hypothetical protein